MTLMQIMMQMNVASEQFHWVDLFDLLRQLTLIAILREYLISWKDNLLSFEQYNCMYNDHVVNLLSSFVIVPLYLRSTALVSLLRWRWRKKEEKKRFVRLFYHQWQDRKEKIDKKKRLLPPTILHGQLNSLKPVDPWERRGKKRWKETTCMWR